jgi:hypothetical protein
VLTESRPGGIEKTDTVGKVTPTNSSGTGSEGMRWREVITEGAFARMRGDRLILLVDAVVT